MLNDCRLSDEATVGADQLNIAGKRQNRLHLSGKLIAPFFAAFF
jgi:hypothetical protein